MVSHGKYSYNRESDIFTTEIDIAHITELTTHEYNYNLRSERREM
jgi:hypothetical protein